MRLLSVFLEGPALLSRVAVRVDMPLSTVLRIVGKMMKYELIRVDRIQHRAGRSLKWYSAASRVFFIPYESEGDLLPDEVVKHLVAARVAEQSRGLVAAAARTQRKTGMTQWRTLIYADHHGGMVVRPDFVGGRTSRLLAPESPSFLNFYSDNLQLTSAHAKQLQREFVSLMKKYKALDGSGRYTLSIVLAPKVSGSSI